MELRRILFRTMLAALGIAALAGVVGVFTAAGETMWRIVATAIITAIAMGLMLRSSILMDKPKFRRGGLAGMVWTLGAYLLADGLIWLGGSGSSSGFWQIAQTFFAWLMCGIPLVTLLTYASLEWFVVAGWTGVVLAAMVFGLFEIGIFLGETSGWDRQQWYFTGFFLAGFGAIAVACLVHSFLSDRRWWRWLGVVAAAGGFIVGTVGVWRNEDLDFGRYVLTILSTFAATVGLFNLVLLAPVAGYQLWVRWGTLFAVVVCAVAVNLDVFGSYEIFGRAVMGSGIVAGCGCLALIIMARMNRRADYVPPKDGAQPIRDMQVVCPRCERKQRVKVGGANCNGCKLRIDITIEEPRCPKCGYLLYMLTSPRCPECGTAIAEETIPHPI